MKIRKIVAVTATAVGVSFGAAWASAAQIDGSIGFAGGFSTPPTLVSTDVSFDIDATVSRVNTTAGDFAAFITAPPSVPVADAGGIDTASPNGMLYEAGGFTFVLEDIIADISSGLFCYGGACIDSRTLQLTGTVSGNGFQATTFSGLWTANGACIGANGVCSGDYAASWSSSIGVVPSAVPLPAAGWLFLSALAGLIGRKKLTRK